MENQFHAKQAVRTYLPARKVKSLRTVSRTQVIQKLQEESTSILTTARRKDVEDEVQLANVPDYPLTLFPTIPRSATGVKGFHKLTTLPSLQTLGRPHFERIRTGGYRIPEPPTPVYLEPESTQYTYVPNLPSFEHKEATPPAAFVASALAAVPPSLEAIKTSGLFTPFEIKCFDEFPDLTKMDSSSTSFKSLFTNVMEKYGISSTGFFDGSTEPLEVTRDSAPDTMMSIQLPYTPAFLSRLRILARDKMVTGRSRTSSSDDTSLLQEPEPMPFETIHINNDKLSDMFQVPKGIYVLKKGESPPVTSFKIDIDALEPQPFGYQPRNPFDFQRHINIPKILSANCDDLCQIETETPKKIAKLEIPNVDILTNAVYTKREKVSESECNAPDCRAELGPDTISENKCLPTTTLHYDPMDTDSDPSAFSDMNCDDLFRNFGADIEMLNQNVYLEDRRFDFNLVDFINSSDLV